MKILLINKFHYLKGGSETYYFELGKMLKEHGHEVAYFSMFNDKNINTGDKEYFVRNIDMNSKDIRKTFDVIYSFQNKKEMEKTLDDFKPDIVHINNFQRQLTASIIDAIKKRNIPIVFTAHDLQAICPASAMLNNGKICEKCLNGSKFNCFKNKCIKDSTLKSFLGSIEGTFYEKNGFYNKIDFIISPSDFVGNMLKKQGITSEIKTIYNFVDMKKFENYEISDENYAFYFGRLSVEKGIFNLIDAFIKQNYGKLYIAGSGPEKEKIEEFIVQNQLQDRIKLLGFLSQDEIKKYIASSSFVVVPSIWYENCPFSILETLAIGKPVVGSKIGGIPELIIDKENGFLYEYDDVLQLSSIINKLFNNKKMREKMGKRSKEFAINKYTIEKYYICLLEVYEKLLDGVK